MTLIWIDFKVKDTVQEGKNTIEDAQMTLRESSNVHTKNVRNSMDQKGV